ncbi:uncharacterized protein LOC124927870 [Impatiens glandulifera]|uniref:uncharacterized protein LOC124927870 n=1 Tax=Impatiens glandulifera TaxID=253017 RepID=UPI001FB162D8|nr:uncharacterized protein LOC124927870 [Impatiens glandulifera]XP_047324316.1 uncharacterized protein LOC124927870 [Impatiens glandulifera]
MGLLHRRSLTIILSMWILWLPNLKAQPPGSYSTAQKNLDAILQDYAYRAFVNPRTGIPFDGSVPSNLTGITISAMRLRSGSLRSRGVKTYKEFEIPKGVIVQPYVERLVLVYQNLANFSASYYSISGYTQLAPVLGLLAYDASNLSATNLPELFINASKQPISIRFQKIDSVPDGSVAMCAWFDLQGGVNFSHVESDNTCLTSQQGHFSIVANFTAAPPPQRKGEKKSSSKTWIIVGSVVGGLALILLLVLVAICIGRYMRNKKMKRMERAAEVGEALNMTSIGNVRAPSAMSTRTQPMIEHDYIP